MYIGHHCDCGHSDLQHLKDGSGKSLGGCTAGAGISCGRPCGPTPAPEVIPTFDAKGNRIERVIEPGGSLESESGVSVLTTCSCDACVALYAEVSA